MNRARAALFAWLLALCAILLPGAATAQRDDARAPVAQDAVDTAPGLAPLRAPPVPADYVREQHGALSISYPRAIASQLRNALAHAEPDARTVGAQLGLTALPPLDVRLVPDPDTMRRLAPEEAPPPAYAVGVAYPSIGLALVSASEPRTWQAPDMRQVLRHELSHVLLAAATNHAPIPRWFSEGVAVHQAGEHSYERFRTLAVASFTRGIVPFDDLDAAFSQGPDRVDVAYAESADFVAYLTRSGDTFRFTVLLQHLRQGLPLDRAFRETYRARR
jgi:hypothetical protein